MSYAERHAVSLTTDASGDATGYTPVVTGRIVDVIYTKDDFADGVDFDVTTETTAQTIWDEDDVNASKTVSPRQPTHDTGGTEQNTAGDVLMDHIYAVQERVKVVVANGGDTKSGTFTVIVG